MQGKEPSGSKLRLSKITPSRPLPPLKVSVASHVLRTANRIDSDYLDYQHCSQSRSERASSSLSDTRLHNSGMVCDSCSTDSMKSTFSLLTPLRAKDVRNRYVLQLFIEEGRPAALQNSVCLEQVTWPVSKLSLVVPIIFTALGKGKWIHLWMAAYGPAPQKSSMLARNTGVGSVRHLSRKCRKYLRAQALAVLIKAS